MPRAESPGDGSAGDGPQPKEALAAGAELYARGEFFEAHEAWEELWLRIGGGGFAADGPEPKAEALAAEPRLFVQGLIQIAAACHKAFAQMQPNGCVKLLTTALEKLEPAPADFMGVRTEPLLQAARAMLSKARAWRDGGPPPSREDVPPIAFI